MIFSCSILLLGMYIIFLLCLILFSRKINSLILFSLAFSLLITILFYVLNNYNIVSLAFFNNIVIKIINKLKAILSNIEIKKDSTQEFRNLARDLINGKIGDNKFNINIWQRRVIKAFPNVDLSKYISYKKRNIKKLFRKGK